MSDTNAEDAFAEAIRLRDVGNLTKSLQRLSQLCKSTDATAATFAVCGGVQWDLGQLSDAIQSFEEATKRSPKSEIASLGLFHTLFEAGKEADSFNEMLRYLSASDSPEYRRLLADIRNEEDEQ